jgi:hypothetical protein
MPVHLIGISAGTIWHTIRNGPDGWTPWENVTSGAGPLSGTASRISCGVADGQLHVCAVTSTGLYHTIRYTAGSWQPWGNAGATAFPSVVGITNVDCVGIGSQLHVCVEGSRRSGSIQTLPAVWQSTRQPGSWTAPGEITGRYRILWDLACGGTAEGNVHLVARVQDVSGSELLIHTIRFPDGSLQPLGDQDVSALYPGATAVALRGTGAVAAAGIESSLHVLASDGTEVRHTIRLDDTSWQSSFGEVRPAVDPAFAGPLAIPAAAGADHNLHVFAISAGTVMHTIRITAPPAWRNPETALTGSFGDVLGAVPSGSAGAPIRSFTDIAAVGE